MSNITAIESLRSFAVEHGEAQFAHLCTAALNGDAWAVERVENAVQQLSMAPTLTPYGIKVLIKFIRATDCTRPDGAIARTLVQP